ncbi:EamA family transporter [Affinibrenneria salicis]|uniref:EamA family transporter n=1 Tax=Affinibrenneria salicis TaxID=2590031 RepID=A0A5J5FR93_9GAMM|nr:EamA family transporter [Affinibrenneria salicis]KAA8995233.1 EamA family transporter [Affinibrenneria salicis]
MQKKDYVNLFSLAAIWGASFLFMRLAAPAFGAVNTAFLRVTFALLALGVMLPALRVRFDFNHKLRLCLTLGVINSGLPFLMYCIAARFLPAGYSAILNATTPLMGAFIGCLFFHEPATLKKIAGVVIGLAGITLITTTAGGVHSVRQALAGVGACLTATACYAVAGFLTKRWIPASGGLDAKLVATGSQMGATLFLLPFFLWSMMTAPPVNWRQPAAWGCILALGVICTALAYILYFRLIADIGPLSAMTVTFLIPPSGVLWGYLILGETLSDGFIICSAVVGLAVWMIISAGGGRGAPRPDK